MDRIEFVIAEEVLGIGVSECVEPVINGESLTDLFRLVEEHEPRGYLGYAGCRPEALLADLRRCFEAGVERRRVTQLLRCVCGDEGCSWATAEVVIGTNEIVWQGLHASACSGSQVYEPMAPHSLRPRAVRSGVGTSAVRELTGSPAL